MRISSWGVFARTSLCAAALLAVPTSAQAALITPSNNAATIAGAMSSQEGLVTSASFASGPSSANAAGTASVAGNYLPTDSTNFAVLTSGDVAAADPPNDTGSAGADNGSTDRGVNDVTILKVNIDVPDWANCVGFDVVFYSEEFPEWVGTQFNDAFIAELDTNDWSFDPASFNVTAPHNFAFDVGGELLTVNTSQGTQTETGLQYDGSTVLLRARRSVTPGTHSIYFTIYDAGDNVYDSAVFLDDLRATAAPDGQCIAGARESDTDGDGLSDDFETNGIDTNNDGVVDLDLPAMGSDPMHKDIYVEVDAMRGQPLVPPAEKRVVDAFANAPVENPDGTTGIRLHLDNGRDSIMNLVTGEVWGDFSDADRIADKAVLGTCGGSGNCQVEPYSWAEFDTIKDANFSSARAMAFHYSIAAHRFGGSNNTITGVSRSLGSSDFLVAYGAAQLCHYPLQCSSIDRQTGTFMHELGHNLGLDHGGGDPIAYKPNYLSVMNYDFQFSGVPYDNGFTFDYSRLGSGSTGANLRPLDESVLDESAGVSGGSGFGPFQTVVNCAGQLQMIALGAAADWNCDGSTTAGTVAADVNHDGATGTLESHNDWTNLKYKSGAIGGYGLSDNLPSTSSAAGEPTNELLVASQVKLRPETADPDPTEPGAPTITPPKTGLTADVTAPKVRITRRPGRVRGAVRVVVVASDNRKLSRLIIVLDGKRFVLTPGTKGTATKRFSFRGRHRIRAIGIDAAGNRYATGVVHILPRKRR